MRKHHFCFTWKGQFHAAFICSLGYATRYANERGLRFYIITPDYNRRHTGLKGGC
jgi:hypothetical protein